jgi:hypothetical protein
MLWELAGCSQIACLSLASKLKEQVITAAEYADGFIAESVVPL